MSTPVKARKSLRRILVHLRDPLEAIKQAAAVTREILIIVEGSFESKAPNRGFSRSQENLLCLLAFIDGSLPVLAAAARCQNIFNRGKKYYACLHDDIPGETEVWTVVAHRC